MTSSLDPSLFTPVLPSQQADAITASLAAFPAEFLSEEAARLFLFQIILPPSLRWAFISVGKSASTSTMHALYQAEFGHPFTAVTTPLSDINPDGSTHLLTDYRVFGRALWQGMTAQDITSSSTIRERICVVRHPLERAISGFRYICRSHEERARWFAAERFQMDAVVGFDWERHIYTSEGFERFLRFIEWQLDQFGSESVNGHWRPQLAFIKPAVFRPTLIGRMEDMAGYYTTLAERLELSQPLHPSWKNRQPDAEFDFLKTDLTLALCQKIYGADYEHFGYD